MKFPLRSGLARAVAVLLYAPAVVILAALGGCLAAEKKPAPAAAAPAKPVQAGPEVAAVPAPKPTPPPGEGWKPLFDGESLKGWKITEFGGHGDARVEGGRIVLHLGAALTGVNFTNPFPKVDYEISFEGMKLDGQDFFCSLTMPVEESHCTFVIGGWGGGVVGISSIDGQDASENETTKFMGFSKNQWYRIRARVTRKQIQGWIDDEKVVDQSIEGRKISMRFGDIELSVPLGFSAWQTAGAIRNVYYRPLPAPAK